MVDWAYDELVLVGDAVRANDWKGIRAGSAEAKALAAFLSQIQLHDSGPAGTSNGPTEAINGCLEHFRGSALGFRSQVCSGSRASTRQPCATGPTVTAPPSSSTRSVIERMPTPG